MPRTIGYHLVKICYGMWLPGDSRGHWSSDWDEQIGYFEPHHLHQGGPTRKRKSQELMKHPATRLTSGMIDAVAGAVGACVATSDWRIVAAAIEETHMHLLMTYSTRDVEQTAKWIAQQTTKAVHKSTAFTGPVWCEGKWLGFVFDERHWEATRGYIERHNVRRGLPARPWDWITA
jgi:REP element-mobilizing transposase RayT